MLFVVCEETAAAAEHPSRSPHGEVDVGGVVENVARHCEIERLVQEWKRLSLRDDEEHVELFPLDRPPQVRHHAGGDVAPDADPAMRRKSKARRNREKKRNPLP